MPKRKERPKCPGDVTVCVWRTSGGKTTRASVYMRESDIDTDTFFFAFSENRVKIISFHDEILVFDSEEEKLA